MAELSPEPFDESVAEQALLEWLAELGWQVAHAPELVPDERPDYREVLLPRSAALGALAAQPGRA